MRPSRAASEQRDIRVKIPEEQRDAFKSQCNGPKNTSSHCQEHLVAEGITAATEQTTAHPVAGTERPSLVAEVSIFAHERHDRSRLPGDASAGLEPQCADS